jgi:hypothetical protein
MKRFTISVNALRLAILTLALFGFAKSASAQCNFPACNQEGESFNSETGDCESSSGFPTFAKSHRVPSCLSGERFDRATGNCVLDACSDSRCEVRALCTRRGERYGRSGRGRDGVYGVCESRPNWLGHRSHRVVRCPAGSVLNEGRGVCVRCPITVPVPVRLPDLIFRRAFLRQAPSGPLVTRVRVSQPYYACFEVANVGAGDAGAFRVAGGGLGIRTPPTQDHAPLVAGAAREGCLLYSTTPPIGTYRLGLTVDSAFAVREARDTNNNATLAVIVVR